MSNTTDTFKRASSTPHYELWEGFEAIDIIKEVLTPEEFRGYLKGNVLKYRLRNGRKEGTNDMFKEEHYRSLLDDVGLEAQQYGVFGVD